MTKTSALRRQLEIYEESWKGDHEEVKRSLWAFEDNLAVGLALFKVVHDRYWSWFERVQSGKCEYEQEEEARFKADFAWWLRPCKHVLKRLIELEAEYGAVEGAPQFRRSYLEARRLLSTWETPTPTQVKSAVPSKRTEAVSAHTQRVLSLAQMSNALDAVSQPVSRESLPLKHKIDCTQVF